MTDMASSAGYTPVATATAPAAAGPAYPAGEVPQDIAQAPGPTDGAVQIFKRDGAKYVLRSKNSSSYPGWTADFTPAGSTRHILEIRLGYAP